MPAERRPGRGEVALAGFGLHTGEPCSVRLVRDDELSSVVLARGAERAPLEALRVVRAERGVRVEAGALSVGTVEHLLAALGGLGVRRGLLVEVEGDELPLLDGGARRFAEVLSELELPFAAPGGPGGLVVAESATIEVGRSSYAFAPAASASVEVRVEFRAPVGAQRARHDLDDRRGFLERIAPARTFGWADEYEALRAAGLAGGVDLGSVIVFEGEGVLPGCRPPGPDEVARHKLLDAIGDLTLYGGPPLGRVECVRPGHAATHAAVLEARVRGVLRPSGPGPR